MRNGLRISVAAAFAAVALGTSALGAGAGVVTTPRTNTVTVLKVVNGTAPADTTFTVALTCESDGLGTEATVDITFDATGQPTSADSVDDLGAGTECAATETVNGGASSTTYACAITRGSTDPGPVFQGNCTADDTVTFGDVLGDDGVITVTNTFSAPVPPVPPAPPVAQAVAVTPTFTG